MKKNGNNSTNNKTSNGTCLALWIRSTISLAPLCSAVPLNNEWEKSCVRKREPECERKERFREWKRQKEKDREWKWASMCASPLQLIVFVFDFLCSFAPVPIDRYTQQQRRRQPTDRTKEILATSVVIAITRMKFKYAHTQREKFMLIEFSYE